jgi:hypothetical protein
MAKQPILYFVLASTLVVASCAKSHHAGDPKPTNHGTIVLGPQGGHCTITSKTPAGNEADPVKITAGGMFVWNVTNNCNEEVTFGMKEKQQKNGNNSPVKDPLTGLSQSPQPFPANGTGTLTVTAKTKEQLYPSGGDPGNRRWTFRFTVNCHPENDPEIEIEGI